MSANLICGYRERPYRSPADHQDGDPPRWSYKLEHNITGDLEERVREEKDLYILRQLDGWLGSKNVEIKTDHQANIILLIT